MIYISDTPYKLTSPDGLPRFHMWADEPGEAIPALFACGADLSARRPFDTWECYGITIEQMAACISLGVLITDKWEPLAWLARRDGDMKRLQMIEDRRARDLQPRV